MNDQSLEQWATATADGLSALGLDTAPLKLRLPCDYDHLHVYCAGYCLRCGKVDPWLDDDTSLPKTDDDADVDADIYQQRSTLLPPAHVDHYSRLRTVITVIIGPRDVAYAISLLVVATLTDQPTPVLTHVAD